MLIEIIGVLIVLAAILAIIAAMQPDQISVTRTAFMTAAPEKVFAQVNDLHAWDNWSPWAKIDPEVPSRYLKVRHPEPAPSCAGRRKICRLAQAA